MLFNQSKPSGGVPSRIPPSPVRSEVNDGNLARKPVSTAVVVVEDEDAMRELICERLRGVGYEVFGTASATVAQLLLLERNSAPMILVTDLGLGGDAGWSLAQWAWERFPTLPVVFISGCIDEFVVRSALGHGNATFLQKPFSLDALVESLHSLTAA